jgi:myo-inositol-1(or 4)-monophosphatase
LKQTTVLKKIMTSRLMNPGKRDKSFDIYPWNLSAITAIIAVVTTSLVVLRENNTLLVNAFQPTNNILLLSLKNNGAPSGRFQEPVGPFFSSHFDIRATQQGNRVRTSAKGIHYNVSPLKGKMNRDVDHMLRVAEKAAMEAGKIMKETSGNIDIAKTKANAADIVTESDIKCQQVIKAIVQENFPDDMFLGEEDVETGSMESSDSLKNALKDSMDKKSFLWVVDPIDGTTNFQAGLPMFCCSIGVMAFSGEDKLPEIIVGVVYNPILDEMTSAVRGKGSFLNGKPLKTRMGNSDGTTMKLSEAMVNVGFPVYTEATLNVSSKAVFALATKVRGLRMIASASQVMCWVAQGKFNAYVSWDLNAWDIAAGILIIEESGGRLSNFDGTKASIESRDIIMTSNDGTSQHGLNEELRNVLRMNDCLEY